jgi:glycine cleavage system H protein
LIRQHTYKKEDEMKLFTEDHEWVELVDGVATVGITDFAQDQLGDIVFVQLPDVGRSVSKGESIAEIESTKSVSDIYTPVTGTVTETNEIAVTDPGTVNTDPESAGWLFRVSGVEPSSMEGLMSEAEYQVFCKS